MARSSSNYDWYCMVDPGTSGSAFAVLFAAVDIYLPFIFYADEIYEKDVEKTVTPYTGPLIYQKAMSLHPEPDDWKCYYDSAAPWFAAHFRQAKETKDCGLRFAPVHKSPGEKEDGLDTLNALFISNSILISTRCGNTIWEYENYCRDKKGKLPKRNDHQVDNGRYLVKMAGIIAGLSVDKPLNVLRRKAKNVRDYMAGHQRRRNGVLNLKQRIMKQYGE